MRFYGNRCPHVDSADLAAVHFLEHVSPVEGGENGDGGTGFYLNRALNSSIVLTRRRDDGKPDLPSTDRGMMDGKWDIGRNCAPMADGSLSNCSNDYCVSTDGGALSSNNELYEQLLVVAPRRNRLVMYPGALWHSANIQADLQATLSCDPRHARLSANTFWQTVPHRPCCIFEYG
eukprot:6968302-Prymnesium_polylepis.1